MQVRLDLIQQPIQIPLHLDINVFTKARQVLLCPIPALHSLFEELAGEVEGFLECKLALALKNVDRVVRYGFRLGLFLAVGEDVVVPGGVLEWGWVRKKGEGSGRE